MSTFTPLKNRATTMAVTHHAAGQRWLVTVKWVRKEEGRFGKQKAFVFGSHLIVDKLAERPPFTEGDPLTDEAWKAFNRLEVSAMRGVLESVSAGKWNFSRKAGCSCGCSPGFTSADRRGPADMFVTVEPF